MKNSKCKMQNDKSKFKMKEKMKKLSLLFILVILFSAVSIVYADTNEDLLKASREGNIEIVQALLDKGADINTKYDGGITALLYALSIASDKGENYKIARLLIENGANVRAKDNNGWTALKYASASGSTAIVELLKQVGAKKQYC